ncbi:MAG TPA: molybdenum cofactor biosynthesis protein MoaE [Solirubrobacteraceae bacterium]|nr:molybdenum cofactor biosynthesis protein MoaE [Solirubrobacteraceae bacterium]
MRLEIRLFAGLRERAGSASVELELDDGATVGDAIAALATLTGGAPVRMAVNRELAGERTPLAAGDELALIPPVSGGAATAAVHARISAEELDVEGLRRAVVREGAGAVVVFCGVTREVARLDYEAYVEMAQEQLARIAERARAEHGLEAIAIEHRVGAVALGEPSVVVAVAAAHRDAAFAGARAAIDAVKEQAAIWKREVGHDGSARWVEGSA